MVNFKKYFGIVLSVVLIAFFYSCSKEKEDNKISKNSIINKKNLAIDINESFINWTVRKTNGYHTGTLKIQNGNLNLDNGLPVSGDCTIDMNSITVTDIKDSAENKKAIEFLKSKDMFDVEKYPIANMHIRIILPLKTAKMPNVNSTVKGNITIKDTTSATVFTAFTKYYEDKVVCKATFTLKSAIWNIPFSSVKFDKDSEKNPIKDDFEIELYIVAK